MLNSNTQKTTGFSPIYLLTGIHGSIPDITTLTESIPKINSSEDLENNRKLAYERIRKQAEYAKNLFDKTRKSTKIINIGDLVFHPSGDSHLAKLDKVYEGPFEVIEVLPNDRYGLKNLATNRKRIVAKDMIRIWPGELSDN